MSVETDLITAQTLADTLNLSVDTIWRYTRENRIPFIKLGSKQYRYNLKDVIAALSLITTREKESGYEINPHKHYTYQDYLCIPEEPGLRFEILEGELIREPSPGLKHQMVSMNLIEILLSYFRKTDPTGKLFHAPMDVTFKDITVVQPDILFISSDQKQIMKVDRIDGPPMLAVEIISPSTRRKDYIKKLQVYQRAGVQHYWIVDPEEQTMQAFALNDDTYTLIASGMDYAVLEHRDFPGLTIQLADLWQYE